MTWTAALVALFLVFVLPACWSAVMTRAWVERGQGPSSSNTNEEREEKESCEEHDVACVAAPPQPEPPRAVDIAHRRRAGHHTLTVLASVAPKLHPSKFSERRLR